MYMYVYMSIHTHVYIYTYMCIYMYVYMCVLRDVHIDLGSVTYGIQPVFCACFSKCYVRDLVCLMCMLESVLSAVFSLSYA